MGTSGLGTLLVEEGLLTEADRRTIRRTCGTHGSAFARAVLALGLLDEDELAAFLAERTRWKMCAKDLARESSREAWGTLDPPLVERLEVMPLRVEGQVLHVAMVDPLDHDTIKQVEFFTGYRVTPHIATFTQVRLGLEKLIKNYRPQTSHLEELIINHASSANRRLRLLDRAGGSTAPRAVSRAPAFDAGAATALREEEDFAGPIEEVEDVDADAAL